MSADGPCIRRLRPSPSVRGSRARLFVLAYFSPTRRVLTAEQIAAQLELLPATVRQVAAPLVLVNCLEVDRTGAYRLASGLTVNDER